MKFRFISDHRETFKVGRMCKLLNVSRSGYHAWMKRPESRRKCENRALEAKIRVLHVASHGIYGAPRIHRDLIDDGIQCGKNRVARIMHRDLCTTHLFFPVFPIRILFRVLTPCLYDSGINNTYLYQLVFMPGLVNMKQPLVSKIKKIV